MLTTTTGAGRSTAGNAACVGVQVVQGDDLQAASRSHPEGTTFCLKAGVYRLASVVPKAAQRFVGEGLGTVLNGAKVLQATDARRDGSGHWYWADQTQQDDPHGTLIGSGYVPAPNEGDRYGQELFSTPSGQVADPPTRLQRVTALSDLRPGRWYLDQTADRLYVADDPASLGLIETSVAAMAIGAPPGIDPSRVTIENMVVEKYASPAQVGAVGTPEGTDWTIKWVTVRYNHGAGIELGPGTLVEHSSIHHMGQVGLTGGGDATTRPTIVRSTEVAYNLALTFDPAWDGGGAKFFQAYGRGLVVENCWFHHNAGYGLWLDIDNDGVIIRSNRVEANDRAGIFYEVSRNAQIYWNEVFGQTKGPDNALFEGAGIFISNSADVDVYHNLIRDNANGIYVLEDREVTRETANLFRSGLPHIEQVQIRDNDIQMPRGITGMRVEKGDASTYWNGDHVSFTGNTYRMDETRDGFVGPGNAHYKFAQWQDQGQDRTGRVLPVDSPGSLPSDATTFVKSQYGAVGY